MLAGFFTSWIFGSVHVDAEELHKLQLGQAGLVAQVCADVADAIVDTRCHGHGKDG